MIKYTLKNISEVPKFLIYIDCAFLFLIFEETFSNDKITYFYLKQYLKY